jgi:hypothetical protein
MAMLHELLIDFSPGMYRRKQGTAYYYIKPVGIDGPKEQSHLYAHDICANDWYKEKPKEKLKIKLYRHTIQKENGDIYQTAFSDPCFTPQELGEVVLTEEKEIEVDK